MKLTDALSPSLRRGRMVIVPIGSLEQHGPHLPLDTDSTVASAVASRLAAALDADLAPAVAYGSSGEHQSFAGTISMGTDVLTALVVEIVRSLHTWAGQVVLVNGHGGNVGALRTAVEQLRHEGHGVAWVPCNSNGDLHAGRSETSLMLHLDPARVRLDLAEPGNTQSLGELFASMRSAGVAAVSPNGVLGDPAGASADEGGRLLDAMVADALARLSRADLGAEA